MSAEGSTNVPLPEVTEFDEFNHSIVDDSVGRIVLNNNYNPFTQGI